MDVINTWSFDSDSGLIPRLFCRAELTYSST
jgi:hypothetical protein